MINCLILPLGSAAVLASMASANAYVISFGSPTDKQLRATQSELAFKARITRIEPGPMKGIPHAGFSLQLQVVEAFNGTPDAEITVRYSPCHWVPGKVGDTVNVIAQKVPSGQFVAMYR